MKFKLTSAYSLCITISFELPDVSTYTVNPNEVNAMEIIMFSLAAYYSNAISILMILMSARKMEHNFSFYIRLIAVFD